MNRPMKRCDECGGYLDRPGLFGCTEKHPKPTVSQEIVMAIEKNLGDRRGLRQEWEAIDNDRQEDIRECWEMEIFKILYQRVKPCPQNEL